MPDEKSFLVGITRIVAVVIGWLYLDANRPIT